MSGLFSSQQNKPVVSIIIPSYNRSGFLEETIDSIRLQLYRPVEVIIVDDGSSDDTAKKIEEIKQKIADDFEIKYIYQNNSGAPSARNNGIKYAEGKYIQYLDSDDLVDKDKLDKQVSFLETNPEYDGVWGDWKKITGNEIIAFQSYESDNLIEQFLSKQCVVNFSFLMKRDFILNNLQWDENLKRNQEIDFHCSALLAGGKFKYLPGNTGFWRVHDEGRISETIDILKLQYYFDKWEMKLKQQGLFTKQIADFFSGFYFQISVHNNINSFDERVMGLVNAIRLNPEIKFINTTKMKVFNKFLGTRNAARLWLKRAQTHQKRNESKS